MRFGQRLRSRWWRGRVEDEVDAEFDFHVEMRTRQYIAGGLSPADAREAAVRRFGDIDRVNARCRALGKRRDREMRHSEYLLELRQDIRFALRQLRKNPGFTTVAVLTLSLGIAATTAIFSAVNAVVLRPLPFPESDRIMAIYEVLRDRSGNVSAGNYVDGVEPMKSFSAVTAIQYSSFNLADDDSAERVIGARVTAGFFDVFNVPPAHGRVFSAQEDRPGAGQVVVLSHRLWTRRFAGDPNILGRHLRLSQVSHQVVGVMPASFDFTNQTEELWVPIAFTPERKAEHDEHYLQVYGRLAPGVSREQATLELAASAERLRAAFPRDNAERGFRITSALEELVTDFPRRMFTLLGAVGFVLLIACGNIASLLLARGAARSGELAIRAALGAGRGRILRQLLTESAVLALLSAAAGIALAFWGIRGLIAAAPTGIPRLEQTSIDPHVLLFAVGLAIVCALLFGLAPAIRVAGTSALALKESGRGGPGRTRDRLRTALVAGELAIALVLLVGAGLLIRSSIALQRVDTGFDPSGVYSARLSLPAAEYDPDRATRTFLQIGESLSKVPGVEAAGLTSQVPMGGGGNSNGLLPEGVPVDIKHAIDSRLRIVTPGYFQAMRIPILKGRAIDERDRRGGLKVMVISQSLATAAFQGQDPIGRRIACCEPGPDGKTPDYKTVVGVAGDVRWRSPGEAPAPEFYLPIDQIPVSAWGWIQRTMYIVARTPGSPESVADGVRRATAEIAPGVPLFNVRTMEERLSGALTTSRFNTLLLTLLGAIGLVLAAVGIYGVVAYFVTRRTQEIGVRMALGATRLDVVALVIRHAAWPVAAGVVIGVGASALLAGVLTPQLFKVAPYDPATFATVAGTLVVVALVASLVPARRAASVDPTTALHTN
ncbi:MAG TPA: ABC transporter permease [Vicinamibacterales bacterium]|nr:ABC transporter permease [Vicinamibacterales bacterium]